ncbi:Crp/Fnr family transcriptional regulator [Oceanobacillus bengalensis]|uniref:Crp/Fnr family transcriptional regulator n=1 Tax=Oceanobacillus bengalensis TaxID=1435466 RepID=A0A494Z6E3_9BACI|nr:Crp/Fnr family transcriptional regulator [Oceanobacillus bengalensis]RKQ17567.1 Crp/Fnr family transcriptional regulator [Oceanobacillus bengalensis]
MQTSLLLNSRTTDKPISKELRALLDSISTVKSIEKDTFVFHEGAAAEEIYIIKQGLVQISKLTADGKEMILRVCKNNDIIGELTLFSDHPKYLLSAKVLESGEIFVINKNKLEKELMTNSVLTFEFMKWTSNHMRKFQTKIRDLLLNGKKGAVYSTLIRLSNSYGITQENGILIDLTLTNQELANFCAATRESVNRILVQLRKLDIITIDKTGRIFIKDIGYLRDEIGCENCPIEVCNIN